MAGPAGSVTVCDIPADVTDALKRFRFRKHTGNSALILKVDREKQCVLVEDELEDVAVEQLQDVLPGHQPRYVIYSYKMAHADGRTSFPLCFIFYTPRDSQTELQIMYAGTQRALAAAAGVARALEARELEELTEPWLREKL